MQGECRRRVGYTVDMSVNLGNLSHFDVHDASQGFTVWAEEVPGCGENWFLVLPNVHGLKRDRVTKFRGMAVKLGHGVAISWDGRVIRHCTSMSHPDGMEYAMAGKLRTPTSVTNSMEHSRLQRKELFGPEKPKLQQVGT